MKKLLLFILIISLSSCGPWIRTGGVYNSYTGNFQVELPEGWYMSGLSPHLLAITKDGFQLQAIHIMKFNINKTEFKFTKKILKKNMLPSEAAEVVIDNMASNPEILNLEVKDNKPAKISGHTGFRLYLSYRDKNLDRVKMKRVFYGLVIDEWFYYISYTAPARYYFDKDLNTFEKIVKSFRITKSD